MKAEMKAKVAFGVPSYYRLVKGQYNPGFWHNGELWYWPNIIYDNAEEAVAWAEGALRAANIKMQSVVDVWNIYKA